MEWISLELGEEKHFQNNGLYKKINKKIGAKKKISTCRPEEWSSVVKYLMGILEAWKAIPSATNTLAYMKNNVSLWYLLPWWDN